MPRNWWKLKRALRASHVVKELRTWQLSNATVKRITKTFNLFSNIAAERFEKQCCAFYHPRSTCLETIRLFQVTRILTSNSYWLILRGSHAIYGSYVTCCKTSLSVKRAACRDFVAKSRTTSFLLSATFFFHNLQQFDLLPDRFLIREW